MYVGQPVPLQTQYQISKIICRPAFFFANSKSDFTETYIVQPIHLELLSAFADTYIWVLSLLFNCFDNKKKRLYICVHILINKSGFNHFKRVILILIPLAYALMFYLVFKCFEECTRTLLALHLTISSTE